MAEKNLVTTEERQKVEELISKHPGIFEIMSDRNKVLCLLTKHELALSVKALESYINGKRFQLLLKKVKKPEVVLRIEDKYKEYFVPSKKSSSRLFCTLTRKEINKLPHEIEKYITGYKFMKAIDKAKKLEAEGIDPTLHTEEDEEEKKKEDDKENEEKEVEEDVPFFALSDEEEEGEEEGEASGENDEADDDDIIEEEEAEPDEDIEMKENAEPEEEEEDTKEEKKGPIVTDDKENDIHVKKRKNKSKSNKGTKKVKHGAK